MMSRLGTFVAIVLVAGVLLYGVLWGLLVRVAGLLAVIVVAAVLGNLVLGRRLRAGLILPAVAGALVALIAIGWLGLPALVTVGGIPVFWSFLGATVALIAVGRPRRGGEREA